MEKNFIIKNNVEEISKLAEKIEILAENWNLSMPLSMNINLVLEEAISNIIFYAFDDEKIHDIDVFISLKDKDLKIIITDDGKSFDPTSNKTPDINLPLEDRPIGGLGIFLISKIMDEVNYERFDNKNKLILSKKI